MSLTVFLQIVSWVYPLRSVHSAVLTWVATICFTWSEHFCQGNSCRVQKFLLQCSHFFNNSFYFGINLCNLSVGPGNLIHLGLSGLLSGKKGNTYSRTIYSRLFWEISQTKWEISRKRRQHHHHAATLVALVEINDCRSYHQKGRCLDPLFKDWTRQEKIEPSANGRPIYATPQHDENLCKPKKCSQSN